MGGMLSQPITTKNSSHGQGLGLSFGLSSMQGWRLEMEDAHDVRLGLDFGLDDWSFFAVFDGHAGSCAALYAAANLLDFILRENKLNIKGEHDQWKPRLIGPDGKCWNRQESATHSSNDRVKDSENECPPESGTQETPEPTTTSTNDDSTRKEDAPAAIEESEAPKRLNNQEDSDKGKTEGGCDGETMEQAQDQSIGSEQSESIKIATRSDNQKPKQRFDLYPTHERLSMAREAIISGFLTLDEKLRVQALDMSGCTAVCALISPTHLFIANCGDSRAVLCRSGAVKFATEDHKPYVPTERLRIIKAGGIATQRINGSLAVSRALGDFEFKKDPGRGPCDQMVSPEPEVTVIARDPDDEFLILACDGIWDVISLKELCDHVKYLLMIESDLEKVCSIVLDICLRRGSKDNMSMILIVFESGPKVDPKKVEQNRRDVETLLKLADSLQKEEDPHFWSDFNDFFTSLKEKLNYLEGVLEFSVDIVMEYSWNALEEQFNENCQPTEDKQASN